MKGVQTVSPPKLTHPGGEADLAASLPRYVCSHVDPHWSKMQDAECIRN
jgi:hypothetical protein